MNLLDLLSREKSLFSKDLEYNHKKISNLVKKSNFLVIGGAGTIGQACVKEIFKRNPSKLHVIDINENNLVELVRDLRSSLGYIEGDFKTFTLDVNSKYFEMLLNKRGTYDFVMNLSAMKHVRNDKDHYSLMRMIETNFLSTKNILRYMKKFQVKKYFCVSTDKASSPINMMGASKRIMEHILFDQSNEIQISTARFANIIFSDGSLMCGVENRFKKKQPISAPYDIKRYFLTSEEAGQLCLASTLLGKNREIFFPNPFYSLASFSFPELIEKYLSYRGYKVKLCQSEDEARSSIDKLIPLGLWPCFFFKTDTTGEKEIEQFYSKDEELLDNNYKNIGVLSMLSISQQGRIDNLINNINNYLESGDWAIEDLVKEFKEFLPHFSHVDAGKSLEEKM